MPQFDHRLGPSSDEVDNRRPSRRNSMSLVLMLTLIAALVTAGCAGVRDNGTTEEALASREARRSAPPPTSGSPDAPGGSETDPENLAAVGQQLYMTQGCVGCHSLDGSQAAGPTWQGLLGSEVSLQSGETVTADEAYITESIVDPGAKIHEGFANIMPSFAQLSQEDIQAIIAFMETLQ